MPNHLQNKKQGELNMRKINTETIALTGVTAAVYMVATLAVSPIAFGAVQFRLSEVMVLLAWINPAFAPGLVLGCALANMFSPLGIIDVLFGTFHTFCSVMMINKEYVSGITLAYYFFFYNRTRAVHRIQCALCCVNTFGNGWGAYLYYAYRLYSFFID